ncbi:MAG TPA: hypothetical protein VH877_26650 [Polyangia bacterium]|jgi:hypothetical protein|nr:hypothetical protein [Polyangia bacterium]
MGTGVIAGDDPLEESRWAWTQRRLRLWRNHRGVARVEAMARLHVVNWNGKDVPPELQELPAGRYVMVEYARDVTDLSPEEDAGITAGLDEIDRGETVSWEDVRADLAVMLNRPR